jgi:hypothetical protein
MKRSTASSQPLLSHLCRVVAIAFLISGTCRIQAADVVWTNTAGGYWNVAANWSPNGVPASADTVFITNAGTYAVTVNTPAAIAGLKVGGSSGTQTLNLSNSITFGATPPSTVSMATNTVLNLYGGFYYSDKVTIEGEFNWWAGEFYVFGTLVLSNTATVNLSTAGGRTLRQGGVFNYTTVHFNDGTLSAGAGGGWYNMPGSTLIIAGDFDFGFCCGNPRGIIENYGTIRKSAGNGVSHIQHGVNNHGLVQVDAGFLSLDFGGLSSGIFQVNAGTTNNFGGASHGLQAGASFEGLGVVQVAQQGSPSTLSFDAPITISNHFILYYGTIDGSGIANFAGPFDWLDGTMSGSGKTVFTNTATVNLPWGNAKRWRQRTVDNYTAVTCTGGGLLADSGGVWNNMPGSTFTITDDHGIGYGGTGGYCTFNNYGTFRKIDGSGTADFQMFVRNGGAGSVLRSQSGGMNFPAGFIQTNGLTELAGGNLSGTGFDILGGTLAGNGNIAGPVRNNGAIVPGNPMGFLSITNGGNFTNTAGGTCFLQFGGASAGVNHDIIRVEGTAILSGSLNISLTNGYVPPQGLVHTAMTFTARSGVFTNSNASALGLVEVYTPTNLLLIAGGALPQLAFTVNAGPTQSVCRPFSLSAQAYVLNGTITNLAILLNGSPIAQTTNFSLDTTLEIDFAGTYSLEARAMDDQGALAISNRPIEISAQPLHVLSLGGIRDTNSFKLCMEGQTGSNYMVQATTNLLLPAMDWQDVGLMSYSNGSFRYLDNGTLTNLPARYYRARQQ